jgi:hypothetical protein
MTLVTLGTFTTDSLTAQPYTYEGDARTGLTARTYRLSGLLTASQWSTLRSNYDTWRNARIQDADTIASGTVGSTINLTINSANGISISSVACWFTEAPTGEQVGSYINATATLVNAADALQVALRTIEKDTSAQDGKLPSLGTVTLGSATVTLTKPLDTRQDGPNVALTAGGTSYVTGALTAHKVRQIEGIITSGTFADVLSWYDTTIASVPASTSWFPISPPVPTAEVTVTAGVKATRYSVSLTALQIL